MEPSPIRRILVALDLSRPSEEAWRLAQALARPLGAALEAIHVRPARPASPEHLRPLGSDEESHPRLRALIGDRTVLLSPLGRPADEILARAHAGAHDLLVLGTHARAGLRRLFLGSTACEVLRRARLPVIVTPRFSGRIRSVLAPAHFLPYARDAVVRSGELAASLSARLSLLHVVPRREAGGEALARLRELAAGLPRADGAPPQLFTAVGDPVRAIGRLASGFDLVGVSGHHGEGFSDAQLGGTAERLSRLCPAPLLVWPVPIRLLTPQGGR